MNTLHRWLPVILALSMSLSCTGEDTGEDTHTTPADAGDASTDTAVDDDTDSGETDPDQFYPRPPLGFGFHRRGSTIRDPEGRVVTLHSVNVADVAKRSDDYMTWHEPRHFEQLARRGFNSVRLLMTWAAIMPEEGEIDEAYLERLEQRIEWAHQASLLVVLDMHQDLFGQGFDGDGAPERACDESYYGSYEPTSPWWQNYLSSEVQACFDAFYADDELFDHFADAWIAVAERYGDHPAVVGFDLLNEPHWGTAQPEQFVTDVLQPRFDELAAELLDVARNRIVFYQGPPIAFLGLSLPFEEAKYAQTGFSPHRGLHDLRTPGRPEDTPGFEDHPAPNGHHRRRKSGCTGHRTFEHRRRDDWNPRAGKHFPVERGVVRCQPDDGLGHHCPSAALVGPIGIVLR